MFVKGGLIMLLKMVFLIYIQVIHKPPDTIGYIRCEFDVGECFPSLSLATGVKKEYHGKLLSFSLVLSKEE